MKEQKYKLVHTEDAPPDVNGGERVTGSRLTGMDEFILKVMRLFKNGRVYVTLQQSGMRFQAAFMAVTTVDGKIFSDTYITGGLSVGMSHEQVEREADIVAKALAAGLAGAVFLGQREPISKESVWLPEMSL